MSEPFLAEIRMVGFNFAPRGWAFCDGQILPINQNQSLFSLLGTTYGGNGSTSFALPDLRSRTPIHVGSSGGANHSLGSRAGTETHTLAASEMPQHTHALGAHDGTANRSADPAGNLLGKGASDLYQDVVDPIPMGAGSVSNAGGGQAHDNMQPFLAVSFCIALQGLFPPRN